MDCAIQVINGKERVEMAVAELFANKNKRTV
jgi:hypothetical protein